MASATVTMERPRTTAQRHRLLTVIGALIAATLIAGGAFNLLELAARHEYAVRSSYAGVLSLKVDASGDVRLTAAPAGTRLTVVVHVAEALERPRRDATLSRAGELHLTEGCPFALSIACSVSYDIALPSGIAVNVNSGAGDITAMGLTTTASVSLRSGTGDIEATKISAPRVRLDSGAGDIDAQLTMAAQLLESSSGDGNITLTVPNVPYAVHASSSTGTVSDKGMRIDAISSRGIDASSAAGNVTIRPAH